jgi:hypothetical protein
MAASDRGPRLVHVPMAGNSYESVKNARIDSSVTYGMTGASRNSGFPSSAILMRQRRSSTPIRAEGCGSSPGTIATANFLELEHEEDRERRRI